MTKKAKAVMDVKGPQVKPEPKKEAKGDQIQVHRGNVDILTLRFLEMISMSLGRIEKQLERLNNG